MLRVFTLPRIPTPDHIANLTAFQDDCHELAGISALVDMNVFLLGRWAQVIYDVLRENRGKTTVVWVEPHWIYRGTMGVR